MMRQIAILSLLLLVPLLSGCSDSTGPGGSSATGTYNLRTVNGNNLPVVVLQVGSDRVEVTQGSITLNADNTFTDRTTFRVTESGTSTTDTEVIAGTYTRNNNAIQFSTDEGDTYSASLSGNTLTQTIEGFVLVYQK